MNSVNAYKYFTLIHILNYMILEEEPYFKQKFSSNHSCHELNTILSTNLNINHPNVHSLKDFWS